MALPLGLSLCVSAEEAEEEKPGKAGRADEILPEMTVVASRTGKAWIENSGSVTSFDSDELVRDGVQDIGGLIKYDPLIAAPLDYGSSDTLYGYGNSGYAGINIRGVEGNRVAMEIDGIRQPPQYISTSYDKGRAGGSGGAGRDYFDPAMFNLVEVLKGGASALYGSDAMGGVVSYRTLDAGDLLKEDTLGGLLRTQYFSANDSLAVQAGGAVEKGNFRAMLMYAGREGHETENNGDAIAANPVDFHSHALLGKFDYSAGEHRFQWVLESYERSADIDTRSAVVSSALGGFDKFVDNFQDVERQRASLRWEYQPADQWFDSMEAMTYWQHAENRSKNHSGSFDVVDDGIVVAEGRVRRQNIDFGTDLYGQNFQARREISHGIFKHAVLAGVDASIEESEAEFFRIDSSDPFGRDYNKTPFAPSTTGRFGLYAQDDIAIGQRWSVTPGLRLDYQFIHPDLSNDYLDRLAPLALYQNVQLQSPEDFENFSLSPRLDIAFKPSETSRIYGTYSRGIRNPTAEELTMIFDHPPVDGSATGTISIPNPDLKEEISNSFELGYKSDSDAGRFQLAGFYTRYKDYIETNAYTGLTEGNAEIRTTLNRGEAEIYGFELGGELKLGHFYQPLTGWTIGLHTGKAIGKNVSDHTWLNTVDPWKTIGFIGYDHPDQKFGLRLTGTYVDAVKHVDESAPEMLNVVSPNGGGIFLPPSYFTLDVAAYYRPVETCTIHVGVNNLLDETYWLWSSGNRAIGGHGGNATADGRRTAPGPNYYLSVTKTF